jgi:hypothetical protein
VQNSEPLPGCTSISLWLNRWRLFKSLLLGQFLWRLGLGIATAIQLL